jgi:uncharacterized protein (TIGR02444 family)
MTAEPKDKSLEIDNPFWRFSLRVYGAQGVAEECIEVQDKFGVDVNVLLYAAWLGATRGVVLEGVDLQRIDATVGSWSVNVVRPLRSVRRGLKQSPQIVDPEVQALRKRVADTELLAEQIEQAMLYRLADRVGHPTAEPDIAARSNVASVLTAREAKSGVLSLQKFFAAAGIAQE